MPADLEDSDDDISEIQQEIASLAQCDSEYVTRYYGSFVVAYKLWIVMEYLAGGSCLDLLKPGPFSEAHIAVIPKLQISAFASYPAWRITSGAIQKGVPTKVCRSVLVSCAATPKSASFTLPDDDSRTLAALISRWIVPSLWR